MKKLIAVIAPNSGDSDYTQDYRVVSRSSLHGLTLKNLYKLFGSSFSPGALDREAVFEHYSVPASGYYLSGLLRAHGYDTVMSSRVDAGALAALARETPFAVCVSTSMILNFDDLGRLIETLRAVMPEVPLVVGGPLVWKAYIGGSALSGMEVDAFVVSPHGAGSLLALLGELDKGRRGDLAGIPNLAIPTGAGSFGLTQRVDEAVDWNADYTRWDLIDEMPTRVPLRTSIGCPYRCQFCDFAKMYPELFLRSPASLAEELALIKARSRRAVIHVTDDLVFANRRRLLEVCQAIIASRAVLSWGGFLRAAPFIAEEIEPIRRSRFRWGLIGVESGDQGQLDRMRKQQNVATMRESIEALDHAGIGLLITMLVGFPGEHEGSIDNTVRFLDGLDVANASYALFPLSVLPLSGIAEPASRRRWSLRGLGGDWHHATMDKEGADRACETIFRAVRTLPYNYFDESALFNRRWDRAQRRILYDQRRALTVDILDRADRARLREDVLALAATMGCSVERVPARWLDDLAIRRDLDSSR